MQDRTDTQNAVTPLLGRGVLLSVLVRSFGIQASWNYERMIGQGFLFVILPGLKKIKKTEDSLKECAQRHLEFFNSHPYMASYALGSSLRLEEQYDSDLHGEIDIESIRRWKKSQITALGSVGDTLFWRSWRPLCGVFGVLTSLLFGWPGPVLYLILYNTLHLYVRITGVFRGYSRVRESLADLHGSLYRRIPAKLESILCLLLGCLGVLLFWGTPSLPVDWGGRLLFLVLIPVFWGLMKYLTPRHLLFLTSVALSTGILIWEIYGGQ